MLLYPVNPVYYVTSVGCKPKARNSKDTVIVCKMHTFSDESDKLNMYTGKVRSDQISKCL